MYRYSFQERDHTEDLARQERPDQLVHLVQTVKTEVTASVQERREHLEHRAPVVTTDILELLEEPDSQEQADHLDLTPHTALARTA